MIARPGLDKDAMYARVFWKKAKKNAVTNTTGEKKENTRDDSEKKEAAQYYAVYVRGSFYRPPSREASSTTRLDRTRHDVTGQREDTSLQTWNALHVRFAGG